jgi:hypothetical protein
MEVDEARGFLTPVQYGEAPRHMRKGSSRDHETRERDWFPTAARSTGRVHFNALGVAGEAAVRMKTCC